MLTALMVIVSITLIGLTISGILVALGIRQTLSDAFLTLERSHARWVETLDKAQDKLLAHTWEEYVSLRAMQDEEEGGFFEPEEQTQVLFPPLRLPTPPDATSAEEEKLLAEDWDDSGEPIRHGAA